MARETIATATASPSRAAWKTVRQEASCGCSRKSRVSTESQPRCTAAQASASMAAMHRRPGIRLNGAGGKHGFQAAAIAAGANGAMGAHREVADVAGHAAVPAQE